MKIATACVLTIGVLVAPSARADEGQRYAIYLKAEAKRIIAEGDRVKGQANLMRREGARLNRGATVLRAGAARLDSMWDFANRANPEKYTDYEGRDRSQQRMRADADRGDKDAGDLRGEGNRLDHEAKRLWELAAAVDPRAQKDLIERIRACCKSAGLEMLRQEVLKMARARGLKYAPSQP